MIRSIDPRSGESFGPAHPEAEAVDVAAAVAVAARAQVKLNECHSDLIVDGMRAAADVLDAHHHELAALADAETALGVPRLVGEVGRTSGQLRAFADMVATGSHRGVVVSVVPEGGPARELRKINVPVGVVAVFAASNFPFAFSVAGGDTAAALAAGCAVIVKAHYGHPQTSERVTALVREALAATGLPPDALQLLHGGTATGQLLATSPEVAAIGFTGSTAGGRALTDLAAARSVPIPVFAEQGSLNPVVLAPTALGGGVDELAERLGESIASGAGQFCTKPGVILVPEQYREEMAGRLAGVLASSAPAFLLTQKIHEQYVEGLARACAVEGITARLGEAPAKGFGVRPVVLSCDEHTLVANPVLRDELFGPAALVVGLATSDGLPAALRALGGSLTGTIHGDAGDPWTATALRVLAGQVGRLVYQGVPTGVAVVPAMHHGGPYPASSTSRDTSVGVDAVYRFLRPLAYQDFPPELLPEQLSGIYGK
jgi:NADP-dependent aldehyde dehydrogenase